MRIAIYHHLHSGGAKRVVVEHAHRLSARHDVALFTLSTADRTFADRDEAALLSTSVIPHQPFEPLPSPWGRLNPPIALANFLRLDRLAQKTAREIDSHRFDVVLAHPCQVTQAPLLLRWVHTPTLYYCHELPRRLYDPRVLRPYNARSPRRRVLDAIDPLPRLWDAFLRRTDRRCALRASRIVVNSAFTRQNVRNAYGREAALCPPGVDGERFSARTRERERTVLSVGALTPNKRFDFVIRALGTIPRPERPRLLIVANYEEAAEHQFLAQLASQLNVALDVSVGIGEAQLRDVYARAGCVAYAPDREPLGLVALEAMASQTPLVAVNEGGVPEMILDGLTGFCVPRDPERFGAAIRRILNEPHEARTMGQNGRRHVLEKWNWETHITSLEALLQQLADRASAFRAAARGPSLAGPRGLSNDRHTKTVGDA